MPVDTGGGAGDRGVAGMRDRTPWSIGSRTNFYLVDPSPREKVAMVAAGLSLRFEAVSIGGGEEDNQVALVPLDESSVENAEFIVKAVNAHDDLVAELASAEQTLRNLAVGDLTGDSAEIARNAAANIRAVIALAEGRGG